MSDRGLEVQNLTVRAGGQPVLKSITLQVRPGEILATIGPAGSGKTTLLRAINRMIDLDPGLSVEGQVLLDGQPVYGNGVDVAALRRKVGLVFSVPIPLPLSIAENLLFGPSLTDGPGRRELADCMEKSFTAANLWEEVKDRLHEPAMNLSGGQQQRLCLARTLMLQPQVLLLDEPCSGLDPISTAKIEEALTHLKEVMAIVLVTNNVKQASRVSDRTAFLLMGELIESGPTQELFTNPKRKETEDYVTGRFG
jgi:phosphate transport system ATP-binding protein